MEQKVKTNGLRWLFCLALMLGLMIGLAGPAMAETTTVNTWADLKNAVSNTSSNSIVGVKLGKDLEDSPSGSTSLSIPSNKTLKLNF